MPGLISRPSSSLSAKFQAGPPLWLTFKTVTSLQTLTWRPLSSLTLKCYHGESAQLGSGAGSGHAAGTAESRLTSVVNLTVMDMLLRSHLLISFPQVGGRATELPSLGRRSGDALQPLQEQAHTHTDGLLPCLLTEHSDILGHNPKCSCPSCHTQRWLCSQTSILPPKKVVCVCVDIPHTSLGYPFLARTGKTQSFQQLLAFSQLQMLSKAPEMLSSQDTPLLIDRAWSSYPDLPPSKGKQRPDAR